VVEKIKELDDIKIKELNLMTEHCLCVK